MRKILCLWLYDKLLYTKLKKKTIKEEAYVLIGLLKQHLSLYVMRKMYQKLQNGFIYVYFIV